VLIYLRVKAVTRVKIAKKLMVERLADHLVAAIAFIIFQHGSEACITG
jgi:hypothetical protein